MHRRHFCARTTQPRRLLEDKMGVVVQNLEESVVKSPWEIYQVGRRREPEHVAQSAWEGAAAQPMWSAASAFL